MVGTQDGATSPKSAHQAHQVPQVQDLESLSSSSGSDNSASSSSSSSGTGTPNVANSATILIATDHPDAPLPEITLVEALEADSSPPTPRFIQDAGSWKRWKWVPYPVRRSIVAVIRWAHGPATPQRFRIKPLFPNVQYAPILLLEKKFPRLRHRLWLLFFWIAIWIITFALVMRKELDVDEIPGWGRPVSIGCGAAYWNMDNGCGLNGMQCRPFTDSGFAFKCPANCASYQALNPRAVGDQEVVYRPLVVGGPPATGNDIIPVYRGDSYLCGSAVHAGVVSNAHGGCGVVRLIGTQRNFSSSYRNGIESIPFDSYFPLSFTFEEGVQCSAKDMRWALLAISVVFSSVLSVLITSPTLFFFPVFTGIYWTVGLATDPANITDVPSLISRELGSFLPAILVAWVMYDHMGIRRSLTGLTAQFEKTVLWLGGCWVGALTNYTFDFIPIQRLTPHDLQQQPGARAALAIIIVVLTIITASQVWFFRQEGRLVRYLKFYTLVGAGLILCVILPDLKLRIHHYILALLLLPGTSMQTRPSLLYQGLLVGLFINGIARWGWDPVLQTAYALQGDAQLGSPLPALAAPVISLGTNISSITFTWGKPPGRIYDGISVLVNDVERFRTYFSDDEFDKNAPSNFTWTREGEEVGRDNEYFRFAWMQGYKSEDYTKAGVWTREGEWIAMAPGPSRVKKRGSMGVVGEEEEGRKRLA
ncbi:hypothetical protein NEUTE1DRAFT_77468 [Neurospora tetrasperma FGSC 2508]|uniref:LCCL domain-containing protein n=1 Tax=Neurospora tetrasperma (strain FGSC 2508 / ATCC MYA-4615 / P0657) TaxID=510951 RepID=F8MDF4_NEUT8|nr:uncharacterized protein NEUTE1DRAFT_77468 [Neurospora tetrasperma FGSC 2508]EGO61445.1 hypothetical protein NEUTE1DRAFT_77468 [Neurospora tetrasperma FGSC 2508]EGZ74526.1 hypothetical protein NEUTE2DRAFT_81937 [Neurospora tetrasperma FGSC 2509]